MWAQLPAPGLLRLLSLKWPTYFELSSSLFNTHPMEPCQGKKKLGAFSIFRLGLSILWCKLLGPGYQVRAQTQSISCLEHFCKEMFAAAKLRQQPEKSFFFTNTKSFFFWSETNLLEKRKCGDSGSSRRSFFCPSGCQMVIAFEPPTFRLDVTSCFDPPATTVATY